VSVSSVCNSVGEEQRSAAQTSSAVAISGAKKYQTNSENVDSTKKLTFAYLPGYQIQQGKHATFANIIFQAKS
jgi:hypothetical protein